MKRVEVTVPQQDAVLIRRLAAELRRDDQATRRRIGAALAGTAANERVPTVAEVIDSLPDISGPEFDAVFEEIEKFRHDPVMMKVRDVEL